MQKGKAALTGAVVLAMTGLAVNAGVAGAAAPTKGGTMKIALQSDTDFTDPALDYYQLGWEIEYSTCVKLLNYPDAGGAEGSKLVPEAAAALPTVSNSGKTYTFTVTPKKFQFSPPSNQYVSAKTFQFVINRLANPKMQSPAAPFLNDIVGAQAMLDGKAKSVSGVKVSGNKLTITLTGAHPDFLARIAMPFFCALPTNTPLDPQGVNTPSAAGPYYIKSRNEGRNTVLARNPYYKGNRPANPDQIVFTANVDIDQSLLQVKAGQSDMDIGGIQPTAASDLAKTYGVNKGRFFVGATSCVNYMAMNNARAPFNNVNLRKAVNWAIDRPAQVRLLGAFAGKRTDQILVPGIPGYKAFNVYALKGADVAKAKQIGGAAIASSPTLNVIHTTSASATNRAQVAEFNLKQVGFKVNDVPTPATTLYQVIETKSTTYNLVTNGGWCADYFDPYDYLNVLFDGRKIQAQNNTDYTYFNSPAFNAGLDHAASLSGTARANAYAKLDQDLMVKYAPAIPYLFATNDYFVSSRVKNWIYSSYFGSPYFNAMSVG